jgi:hypothetical protein
MMQLSNSRIYQFYLAYKELGFFNLILSLSSFIAIILFEYHKIREPNISVIWIIIGVISYTVFASYFGYFFTYLLPLNLKRNAALPYLQTRAKDIAMIVSFIILEIITKSKSGDPNNRDRSDNELIEMCRKIEVYQTFRPFLERNEDYKDFYEYFSFNAKLINDLIEKIIQFADILNDEQLSILLNLEKNTNSALTRDIKFTAGKVGEKSVTQVIPDSYAYLINSLRNDSKSLLATLKLSETVA